MHKFAEKASIAAMAAAQQGAVTNLGGAVSQGSQVGAQVSPSRSQFQVARDQLLAQEAERKRQLEASARQRGSGSSTAQPTNWGMHGGAQSFTSPTGADAAFYQNRARGWAQNKVAGQNRFNYDPRG